MSTANLSGEQFFHGSLHDMDTVLPGKQIGMEGGNYPALYGKHGGRDSKVWMADNEAGAWKWADSRAQQVRHGGIIPEEQRSPMVHKVVPRGKVNKTKLDEGHEYSAQSADVVETYHAPVGQQAQIPGQNWAVYDKGQQNLVSRSYKKRVYGAEKGLG